MNDHTNAHGKQLSNVVKTLITWLLLGAVFAGFNLGYWPLYRQRVLKQPESFMALAETQEEAEARLTLTKGIEWFNPPVETVYSRLATLELRAHNPEAASGLERRARFYSLLREGSICPEHILSIFQDPPACVDPPPDIHDALRQATVSFGVALGMGTGTENWHACLQTGFLELGGSRVSTEGYIGATGIKAPVSLLVYSGGGSDERRGVHLFVQNIDHAVKQRGMHIVLLDANTGAVLRADVFDVWNDAFEATRMLHFLENAPAGCIGMFAVCDDGSAFVTSSIEAGLLKFGIGRRTYVNRVPRVLGLRYSFAAIGIKGASADTALQCWSPEYFQGRRGHPVACIVYESRNTP